MTGSTRHTTEKAERHSSLMSSRHSGIYLDQHWAPQSHLSLPCHANYTFIGKQDHFQDNTRFMVGRLKLNVTLTRENSSSRLEKSLEFWYRQLTSKAKRKLQALYKYDFLLFGFDPTPPGGEDKNASDLFVYT